MIAARGSLFRVVLAMLAAGLVLWIGFTAWVLHDDNYQRVYPDLNLLPDPLEWRLIEGEGALEEDAVRIDRPGLRARFLVAIRLPHAIQADRYNAVEVELGDDRDFLPLSFSWSRGATFSPVSGVPMNPGEGNRFELQLNHLPGWQNDIYFVALENFGALGDPLLVRSVRLIEARPDFVDLQRRLFGDWLNRHPWTQRSAHSTRPGLYPALISPVPAVASWLGLTALLIALFSIRARRHQLLWLCVPVLAGWLVLDLRWQADLLLKASQAIDSLSKLSMAEKSQIGPDADLQAFLDELRGAMPAPSLGRVFVFGRHEYFRTRARYHLLPHSVRIASDERWNRGLAQQLQSGDLVILLDAPQLEVRPLDRDGRAEILNRDIEGSAVEVVTLLDGSERRAYVIP